MTRFEETLAEKGRQLLAMIDRDRESLLVAWLAQHQGVSPADAVLCQSQTFESDPPRVVYRSWVERRKT